MPSRDVDLKAAQIIHRDTRTSSASTGVLHLASSGDPALVQAFSEFGVAQQALDYFVGTGLVSDSERLNGRLQKSQKYQSVWLSGLSELVGRTGLVVVLPQCGQGGPDAMCRPYHAMHWRGTRGNPYGIDSLVGNGKRR